eukprot:768319-Lingulodinium_polyedra.AAC.1
MALPQGLMHQCHLLQASVVLEAPHAAADVVPRDRDATRQLHNLIRAPAPGLRVETLFLVQQQEDLANVESPVEPLLRVPIGQPAAIGLVPLLPQLLEGLVAHAALRHRMVGAPVRTVAKDVVEVL